MSGWQAADPWRDAQGATIPVRARLSRPILTPNWVRCVRGWTSGVECCAAVAPELSRMVVGRCLGQRLWFSRMSDGVY